MERGKSGADLHEQYTKQLHTVLPERGLKRVNNLHTMSEQREADAHHTQLRSLLSQERLEKLGNLSVGEWIPHKKLVKITKVKGKFFHTKGHANMDGHWLYPEEAFFLMETAKLLLLYRGVQLSLEEAYSLLLGSTEDDLTVSQYQAYSCLTRHGFILRRFHSPHEILRRPHPTSKHGSVQHVESLVTNPMADTVTNPMTKTVTNPMTDIVTNPMTDIVTNPMTDTVPNPMADTVTNPMTDTVTNPMTETVTNPMTETVTNSMTDTVTNPMTDTVTNPMTKTVTNPMTDTVTNPMTKTVTNPMTDTVTNPMTDTVTNPMTDTVTEPCVDPILPDESNIHKGRQWYRRSELWPTSDSSMTSGNDDTAVISWNFDHEVWSSLSSEVNQAEKVIGSSSDFIKIWQAAVGSPVGSKSPGAGSMSVDVGSMSVDAGSMSVDVGSMSVDAGSMSEGAGSMSVDAGSMSVDAGSMSVDAGLASVDAGLASEGVQLESTDKPEQEDLVDNQPKLQGQIMTEEDHRKEDIDRQDKSNTTTFAHCISGDITGTVSAASDHLLSLPAVPGHSLLTDDHKTSFSSWLEYKQFAKTVRRGQKFTPSTRRLTPTTAEPTASPAGPSPTTAEPTASPAGPTTPAGPTDRPIFQELVEQYWADQEITPLVHHGLDPNDLNAVFKALRIIEKVEEIKVSSECPVRPMFQVYRPSPSFKKSCPGPPATLLHIDREEEELFPSLAAQEVLLEHAQKETSVTIGKVSGGDPTFFFIEDEGIPNLLK